MSVVAIRPGTEPREFSLRGILGPLVAIVLGTIMAILDSTVVNVALPTLERVFQADLSVIQWVITGYMLAQAAVIPLAGWLSDRFSARRIYLIALALFSIGSGLCALAATSGMLIGFRVLQGLGGGMLQPVGMAILYRLSPPERRGQVMGIFGIPILLGPALGPVLSGWLVQYADWRFIFLINLPIGVGALFLAGRVLPRLPALGVVGRLDTLGVVLAPLGFAALSYGISESTVVGWGGFPTLAGLTLGVTALALFAFREFTTAHPLLDLQVFRSWIFALAIVTTWVAQAAMFGTLFLIPLFLQSARGYGAFETGLATLPQAIVPALLMPVGGQLFDRLGIRIPAVSGLILVTASLWEFSRVSTATTPLDLILPMSLWGAGLGLMLMPLSTYVLNAAPPELVSRVTSLTGALGTVVGSLAIACFATFFQSRLTGYLAALGSSAFPAAMARGFDDAFAVAAIVGVIAVFLAVVLPNRIRAKESVAE